MSLLEVRDLRTYFFTRWGVARAVDGVSFSVDAGETLGLVGESGCGKTVTSFSILRLVQRPVGRIVGGQVVFNGEDLLSKSEGEMRTYRGKHLSMILQDPMTSLNPVFTVGNQVTEAIGIHQRLKGKALLGKAIELLRLVRIPAPEARVRDYPHQLSGGMKQRVVGAISLACEPHLLIADEPTTSLDATIQMQYLNLLGDIQRQHNLAMIFITHDFGIVAKMCHKVAVMYAGKIVEMAEVCELFDNPLHPYTRALMHSVPKLEERVERLFSIEGQPPDLLSVPQTCAFRDRCTETSEKCRDEGTIPEVNVNGHFVRCWLHV